jgi:hypothetical protein
LLLTVLSYFFLAGTGITFTDLVTSYDIIETQPADLPNASYITKRFNVIPFDYVDNKYVRFNVIPGHLIADWYWGRVEVSWIEYG